MVVLAPLPFAASVSLNATFVIVTTPFGDPNDVERAPAPPPAHRGGGSSWRIWRGGLGTRRIPLVSERWSRGLLGRLARLDVINVRGRRRRCADQHRCSARLHEPAGISEQPFRLFPSSRNSSKLSQRSSSSVSALTVAFAAYISDHHTLPGHAGTLRHLTLDVTQP